MGHNRLKFLIKNLSQAEVRNFNWFAQRQRGNHKYKKLFDLYKRGVSSDLALAKGIGVPESSLKVYKSQLKSILLESLLFFRMKEDDLAFTIRKGGTEKDLGLEKDADKTLKAAKRMAEQSESFGHWLNLHKAQTWAFAGTDHYQSEWENNRKVLEYLQLRNIRLQTQERAG